MSRQDAAGAVADLLVVHADEVKKAVAAERDRLLELPETMAKQIESGELGPGTAPYAAQDALREFIRRAKEGA